MEDYIMLKTKLELGKSTNIKYVKEKDIDKIEDIKINTKLPKAERIVEFLKMVKNPYIFMIDGRKVRFEFSESELSINKCMENLIINRKY